MIESPFWLSAFTVRCIAAEDGVFEPLTATLR